MIRPLLVAVLLGAAASAAVPQGGRPAAAPARVNAGRPDSFALGRSASGEPCTASRNWRDPAAPDPFDESWSVTCRNVAASRPLGFVRLYAAAPHGGPPAGNCAAPTAVALPGIGPAQARRCRDPLLGGEAVELRARWRGRWLVASALPAVLGPTQAAMRAVADRGRALPDRDAMAENAVAVASLPAWPPGAAAAAATAEAGFDAALPLAQGISLNHKGLYLEASRVLNDALSRLPADAPGDVRAELQLEAALSDSNIGFTGSAGEHFADADAQLAKLNGPREQFLLNKRQAYGGLDLLNQRRFREALALLDRLVSRAGSADQPLADPATLRLLNRTGGAGAGAAVTVPETAALAQLTLDAQVQWVRSAAFLALGEVAASRAALNRSQASYALLTGERIDRTLVLWLGAQIARQRGRLEARERNYAAAIAAYDEAIDDLRRAALGTAGTGREPAVAEAQLERAVIVDAGGDRARAREDFGQAVDALVVANQLGGSAQPAGLDRYLDLLAAEANAPGGARADTFERAFRAMQAVGEPAVARQVRQLQAVVATDPGVGTRLRDRADLERDITRLRYEIAAAPGERGDLERQRAAAEAKLLAIDAELSSNRRFSAVDDRTVTVADLRAALRPGEAYLKLAQVGGATYGLAVTPDAARLYRVAASNAELEKLAAAVRASVDGQLDRGRLVPFDVAGAYTLFRLLTGEATDAVLAARSLVIDPAGPLRSLPASILVTDRASVDRYAATAAAAPFDFSTVSFLAGRAVVSTAVSPRSFLVTRALPASAARQPFIGLGEHQPPASDGPARNVRVGFGCFVPFATLADLSRRLAPINRAELGAAARGLGFPQAPEVVDAAFSDTAVLARTDLADYQVLHFGTHGLKEGDWGCAKSPPALVTSFGDERSDGLLSFSEIARLRLDANLVFLSACDTAAGIRDEALARGAGQEEAGSTLEGLVRAFLTANARAVLATYWQVSAEGETDRFIQALYGAARARDVGGALQEAQRTLIRDPRYSHPFYWGPYFLVGDATKPMLSGPAPAPAPAKIASR